MDAQREQNEYLDPREQARRIARAKAIAMKHDPHVKALTVGEDWLGPDQKMSRASRERTEYHLRRMWATLLLHQLRGEGMTWQELTARTKRSRGSWLNVSSSDFPEFGYWTRRYQGAWREKAEGKVGRPALPASFKDKKVMGVSRSFIFEVTQALEGDFSIDTEGFVHAFRQGMIVIGSANVQDFIALVESMGVVVGLDIPNDVDVARSMWAGTMSGDVLLCTHWTGGDDHAMSWTSARPNFPLIQSRFAHDLPHREVVLRHMTMIESVRYGNKANVEGWAHRQRLEQNWAEVQAKIMGDPTTLTPAEEPAQEIPSRVIVPTDKPVIKAAGHGADDAFTELGFLPPYPIEFRVHPNDLDKDGNGSVTFEVNIRFKDGRPTGYAQFQVASSSS